MLITISAQNIYRIEIIIVWITLLNSSWSKLLWNPPFNFVTFSLACQKWINGIGFLKIASNVS